MTAPALPPDTHLIEVKVTDALPAMIQSARVDRPGGVTTVLLRATSLAGRP